LVPCWSACRYLGAAPPTRGATNPTPGENAVRPHALTGTETTGPGGKVTTAYDYTASGSTRIRTLPAGNQELTWNENDRLASVTTPRKLAR
jgi:YD repeat-containing protein